MIIGIRKIRQGHVAKCRCDWCGVIFKTKASQAKRVKRNFCSRKCHDEAQSGSGSVHWKGGKKDKRGYIYVKAPKHPKANYQNYVFKHRVIMERHLGRYLKPGEVVHHINGIRDDNRLENLRLFKNNAEHTRFHNLVNVAE